MSYGVTIRSLALAVALGFGLVACGGGGGGGGTATTSTSTSTSTSTDTSTATSTTTATTTVTTTAGSSAVTATAVNTSAAAVAGTGTAGTTITTDLSMADKISVVSSSSAKPTKAPKGISSFSNSLLARLIPTSWVTTADWFVDPQFIFVHERSEEAFKRSNEILCMIGQTEWESMTNQGAYIALVDENECKSTRDSASSAGQSSQDTNKASNANAPNYMQWVIMSKRADATTAEPNPPQVISAWVPGEVGGGPNFKGEMGVIQAKIVVQEKPTATNPYGFFYMSFEAHPYKADGVTVDDTKTAMTGYMRTVKLATGEVVLQFYNGNTLSFDPSMVSAGSMGGTGTKVGPKTGTATGTTTGTGAGTGTTISLVMEEKSTLFKSATGGGGEVSFPDDKNMITAITTAISSNATSVTVPLKQMRFAHDGTSFARQEVDPATSAVTGSPVCLDAKVKESTAWRYGAYNAADGSRITLNTGFPIIYTDAAGADHEGWIGNWGLWLQDGTTVANGATINKYDYATKTKTPYIYKTTGGKLTKHTKVKLTLNDIKNIPLQVGIQAGQSWNQYEVAWNGTAIVAKKVLDQTTWMWTDLTSASTPIAKDTPVTINSWDRSFNFWSQSLNGSGRVELSLCTKADVTAATSNPPAAGSYSNCTENGKVKGTLDQVTQDITPYITSSNAVTFNKEKVVFMGDTANAPATALACTENCPSGANIALFNDADTTNNPTSVEYANTGWSNWDPANPNLSNTNQRLSPANWQYCPNMAVAAGAPSGTNCTTAGEPNWSAAYCTGPNTTAGAGETLGTTCQGFDSNWNWVNVMLAGKAGGYYKYTFDVASYTLTDTKANSGAGLPTDLSTTAGQWVNSGLLFDPLTTGTFSWTDWNGTAKTGDFAAAISCDWPYEQGNGQWTGPDANGMWSFAAGSTTKYGTCTWRLWDTLDVYYTWQTGSDWNTLKLLTDANGKAVTFDEPFILDYIHGAAGTSNGVAIDNTGLSGGPATTDQWYGARMGLQYGGFGDIWGIPGHCVNMDTGLDESCSMTSRWIPAFSIPDESAATYVDSAGTTQTVYIKALEKEERMVPLATCTATLTAYALPAATDYVAPGIGAEPTAATHPNDPIASGAPSVVGGVVQPK